jgi:hypothetical protein
MDQTTQQNAALVEEMAAAASSLKSQANELVQVVAVFKLDTGNVQSPVKTAVRATSPKPVSFKGVDRREGDVPKGAAARAPAPVAKTTRPISPTLSDRLNAPAKTVTAKAPTPAGGDDDWETF